MVLKKLMGLQNKSNVSVIFFLKLKVIPGRSWGKKYDNFHPSRAPPGDFQLRPGIFTSPRGKLENPGCRNYYPRRTVIFEAKIVEKHLSNKHFPDKKRA